MPIPIIAEAFRQGSASLRYVYLGLEVAASILVVVGLKYFFGGARNRSERVMHGKVVMLTGGTSGIGAQIARELATRGAQVILLTARPPTDLFIADYIDDLRAETRNELIYAEQVDLGSLHSIRSFATKWIDNAPPRRLDTVILCASTLRPRFAAAQTTLDGVESCWAVNCLSVVHLLSILSPAIRAQPADRDVRIIIAACGGSVKQAGDLRALKDSNSPLPEGNEFNTSALARSILARQFQRHLDGFTRQDKNPNNARAVLVDPGSTRTPGTRRWMSGGTLWGLSLYLVFWPLVWLILKSSEQGAQSFLYASMEAEIAMGAGGRYVRECREMKAPREEELENTKVGEELWKFAEKQIAALEKQGAVKRALAKKEVEEKEKLAKKTQGTKKDTREDEAKVFGEAEGKHSANGATVPAATTGTDERKSGLRRSRKAA